MAASSAADVHAHRPEQAITIAITILNDGPRDGNWLGAYPGQITALAPPQSKRPRWVCRGRSI